MSTCRGDKSQKALPSPNGSGAQLYLHTGHRLDANCKTVENGSI